MRGKRSEAGGARRPRRIYEERPGKQPAVTGCPRCHASYRDGRWTWQGAPADARESVCPACERIEQDYPAGVLHVGGGFAADHREEIVHMLRNIEERERGQHPLKRIMQVEDEDAGFLVKTTDASLVQSFGRALEKAYSGQLEPAPTTSDTENLVRVRWSRD